MICLDGADGRMLDQYSTDGSLPNLAALRLQGAARSLSAPLGSTDDALWASFQYMLNVGEHGRYGHMTPQRNDRLGEAHKSEDLPTIWDNLSTQGMHVAVLDVPKCRAPRPLNGIHLVDWLTHGEYFQSPQSFPPSLVNEVLQNFGGLFPGGKIVKNYFDGKHQKKNYDAQNPRLPKKTGIDAGQNADHHDDRAHGSKRA